MKTGWTKAMAAAATLALLAGGAQAGPEREGRRSAPSAAVVDALIGALRDEDAEVRAQAALTLGRMNDPRAIPGLVAALKDKESEVRQHAAHALGSFADERATDALIVALKDADVDVRRQAAHALGQLTR